MRLIAGTSNFWNQGLIISVVAPFTRIKSIRYCFLVLRIGFRLRKLITYRFPKGVNLFIAIKIRSAKALIWE